MRSSFYLLLIALVGALIACDDANDNGVVPGNKRSKVEKADKVIKVDEDTYEAIEEGVGNYFSAISEGRFEEYVDMVYPPVFDGNDSMKVEVVKMMRDYAEQGFLNVTNSFEIKHVSPMVDDSLARVCLLIAEIDHDVFLGETYKDSPESLEPMIRTQYGEGQYKYIPEENKYKVQGTTKLYALTPKDEMDFTFLNEQYTESPILGSLLQYGTVRKLKEFEAEVR
jgi:hypothetical protein